MAMYNAVSLESELTSPPFAKSRTADTTKSSADSIATPLKNLLSSAPMPLGKKIRDIRVPTTLHTIWLIPLDVLGSFFAASGSIYHDSPCVPHRGLNIQSKYPFLSL